jgi:hypothetical protein
MNQLTLLAIRLWYRHHPHGHQADNSAHCTQRQVAAFSSEARPKRAVVCVKNVAMAGPDCSWKPITMRFDGLSLSDATILLLEMSRPWLEAASIAYSSSDADSSMKDVFKKKLPET